MDSPVARLSAAVERFRREEAEAQRATWSGGPWRAPRLALREDEALDLLRDAASMRLAPEAELGALAAHLGRAAAERELEDARVTLGRLRASHALVQGERVPLPALVARALAPGDPARRAAALDGLVRVAASVSGELVESRARADEAAGRWLALAPPRPDAPPEDTTAAARAFLTATAAPCAELTDRLGAPGRLGDLAAALELPAALFRADTRFRRIGELLRPLGLEDAAAARVRVEPSSALDPRPRLAFRTARDVRLGAPDSDAGLAELLAAEAAGRALALSLASPALPVPLARPLDATVARAVGALLAGLYAEPRVQGRLFSLSRAPSQDLARRAALAVLLDARLACAALVARAALAAGERDAPDALLADALGVDVGAPLVTLVVRAPAALMARARGKLAGLALHAALREQLDEDFERNPRAAEPLRAAAERGGALSAEAWLAELGVADLAAAAARRAAELVR